MLASQMPTASSSAPSRVLPRAQPRVARPLGRRLTVVRAAEDPDADLEARLEKLRTVKGATPYGKGAKSDKDQPAAPQPKKQVSSSKKEYDWSNETVHYEGPPHRGDLAVNVALGTTLLWLPLTIAAVGRAAFVKYRFTDKRFSVCTNAPWKTEETHVAYQEVKEVVTVGRGVGLWGDMVVTLKNGDKVELRSLDNFLELKKYILERRDALTPEEGSAAASGSDSGRAAGKKGFA